MKTPDDEPVLPPTVLIEVPLRCGNCNTMVSPSAGTCPRCDSSITRGDRLRRWTRSLAATAVVAAVLVGFFVMRRYQMSGPDAGDELIESGTVDDIRVFIDRACACKDVVCMTRELSPVDFWVKAHRGDVTSEEGKATVVALQQRGLDCLSRIASTP